MSVVGFFPFSVFGLPFSVVGFFPLPVDVLGVFSVEGFFPLSVGVLGVFPFAVVEFVAVVTSFFESLTYGT